MRKQLWLFALLGVLLLSLFSCTPSYEGDERIGTYVDKETGAYILVLSKDGKGSITHTSNSVLPTSEEVFFELRDGYLFVNGKSANGAVIGRHEYYGEVKEENGVYTVALKSELTGITLGTFVKEK